MAAAAMLGPQGLPGPRVLVLTVGLPTLLCLGLCLSPRTQAQEGSPSPPQIRALPGSVISSKRPVTILCRGPREATLYKICKVGQTQACPVGNGTFRIPEMVPDRAGLYRCAYQSGGRWSEVSEPLRLVMTGYPSPSLSVRPGTVVAPGDDVHFRCFSTFKFELFILNKEDGVPSTKNRSSTPQGNGHQAVFHMGHVTSAQAGTYQCSGAFYDNPYVWSEPSDPLQLEVQALPPRAGTEGPGNAHGAQPEQGPGPLPTLSPPADVPGNPTEPGPSTAPPGNQSPRRDILIGIPVALALLVLMLILIFILCRRKDRNEGRSKLEVPAESAFGFAKRAGQPEAGVDGQTSEAIGPQEVTYSQLSCSALTRGTPSSLPRQTLASEYATLALH